MIKFDFNKNCYGCRNCENICPVNAIRIKENEEGFLMPSVDKSKCINCGMCDKVCPYLNFKQNSTQDIKQKAWYGGFLKSEEERVKSTSGGIFPALAKYVLEKNGLICGCIWDENMNPIHILTDEKKELEKMRGSKYVQSDLNEIVKQIKSQINDKKILFTGTPCQVSAIKLLIGEEKNLYTCSLICEGVPSNKVWKKYVKYLENRNNSKMINASFRHKEDLGWETPVAKYEFKNKKTTKTLSFNYDKYISGFLEGLYYRNSCSNCQYKGNGHNGDIIIGDLWGANKELMKKSKNKGISAIIINTQKGKELFKKVKENFEIFEVNKEEVISYNSLLIVPINKHLNRDKFYKEIDKITIIKNIEKNIKKYKTSKNKIKEIIYKIGIYETLKNLRR